MLRLRWNGTNDSLRVIKDILSELYELILSIEKIDILRIYSRKLKDKIHIETYFVKWLQEHITNYLYYISIWQWDKSRDYWINGPRD